MPVLLAVTGVVLLAVPGQATVFAASGVLWLMFLAAYLTAPERTILIFIVLAPVVALVPDTFRLLPGLNFDTIIVPTLASAVALARPAPDEPRRNALLAPVVFFAVVYTGSAIASFALGLAVTYSPHFGWVPQDLFDILKSVKSVVLFPFLGPIAFRLLRTSDQARAALLLIAGATTFIAVDAMRVVSVQALGGGLGTAVRAMNFWLNQPNLLGGFFGVLLVGFTSLLLSGTTGRGRLFILGAVVATAVGMVLTFSRGAWIASFAGLAYLGATRGARTALGLGLLAVVGAFFIPQSAIDRMGQTFEREEHVFAEDETTLDTPVQIRVDQWKGMPRLWLASPLFGHGYGSYEHVSAVPGKKMFAAHSSIIAFTVEQGLLGLGAYAWILWTFVATGRRVAREGSDRFTQGLAAGLVGMTICLVLLDCAGQKFVNGRAMGYMWIIAGAVARLGCAEGGRGTEPARHTNGAEQLRASSRPRAPRSPVQAIPS
jgi:hypothetical protein